MRVYYAAVKREAYPENLGVMASQCGCWEAGPRVRQVRGLASAVFGPLSVKAAYNRRIIHA